MNISFEKEALSIVFENEKLESTNMRCRDRNARGDSDVVNWFYFNTNSDQYRYRAEANYRKFGIYFQLNTRVNLQHRVLGVWLASNNLPLGHEWISEFQPKCRNSEFKPATKIE